MNEQLITFKTAKLAKEKGFDEECQKYFDNEVIKDFRHLDYIDKEGKEWSLIYISATNNDFPQYVSAPTQSHLQGWLYEKHDIWVEVALNFAPSDESEFGFRFTIHTHCKNLDTCEFAACFKICEVHKTPFDALEIGLQEALKLLK